jgi:hypothetical protein
MSGVPITDRKLVRINDEFNKKLSSEDILNEIKILEKGEKLDKLHPVKKKFNKRLYKIDLKNRRLVASTKQCGKKEKSCKIFRYTIMRMIRFRF